MLNTIMTAALLALLALNIANFFLVMRHYAAVPGSLAKRKLEAVLDATNWAPAGATVAAAWVAFNGGNFITWILFGWLVLSLPAEIRRLRQYRANKDCG